MTSAQNALLIKRGKLRISTDPRTLLLVLAMCENNIVRYLILFLSMIPGINIISGYLVPASYIFLIIACFYRYRIKLHIKECCVLLFIVFAILFTCLFYPDNTKYIFDDTNFWQTIFPCLKYYIVGLIIIVDKKTLELIGKVSCIGIIIEFLFVIVYMVPRGLLTSDEMSRAYQLLPNVMFALCYAFDSKKVLAWVCSLIGIVYLFAMGTRGPVIVILTYYIFKILQIGSDNKWVRVLTIGMAVGLIALVMVSDSYIVLLNFFKTKLDAIGLSTRVIDLAINGTIISHMAGRDELYELALQKIHERPFLGYGIYGEWPWIGWNIHNMYLELIIHFGVVLGLLVFLWIIGTIARSYFGNNNAYAKDFIMIWFFFVFVRGLFGGSYLQFGMAILIGFCISERLRLNTTTINAIDTK